MIEKLQGQEIQPDAPGEAARFDVEGSAEALSRIPDASSEEAQPGGEEQAAETAGAAPLISMEPAELRGAIEAILFSVSEPIPIRTLSDVLGLSLHDVRQAVEDLRLEYVDLGRAFRIEDIAGGIQVLTLSKYDPWIRRLREKERESRLTPAAMETLAVIAYKQPIGKADLEGIRGVGCGPTLKTLLERGLIQIAGRGEGLGKPLLYGTTRRFLESFGIASVRDLPQPDPSERSSQPIVPALPEPAIPAAESQPEPAITDAAGPLS